MLKRLRKIFKRDEKGQGMVEYGLILALVSVVALGALGGIGGSASEKFDEVVDAMKGPNETDILINEGYIPVASADELNGLRDATSQTFGKGTEWEGMYLSGLDKKYIQVTDIDLNDITNFQPIGTVGNRFKGSYDGGGHVINNLTIDKGSTSNIGLFGYTSGSTLKNIGLVNVNVKGGKNYVGGLVGYQTASSHIINSYTTGIVIGGNQTGGLVGNQNNSTITNSYSAAKIISGSQVGGLVGWQNSSNIIRSYSTGQVIGTGSEVGGLVGYNNSSNIIDSGWANDIGSKLTLENHGISMTKVKIDKIINDLIR